MRVAFVSPLPPEPTGIGDYSYELLEELGRLVEITAVVRDDRVNSARVPEGVGLIGIASHRAAEFDVSVYQMGNNPKYHRYLFGRALDEPGLLVLHDPSLADFYAELCGGAESSIFREEVAYDRPEIGPKDRLPLLELGDGRRDLDRMEVMLARRLVSSNIRTLVHSEAIAALLRQRYAGSDVQAIQLPAQLGELDSEEQARREARAPGEIIFGVFGGINYYKRVEAVVEAFIALHEAYPAARLVIAGRADDRLLTARIRQVAGRPELAGSLEVLTDLSLSELESQMARCDVAISLRWPTAGEMSATLIRTFGAGRPAIVSDVFQFAELDERYCWRVPIEAELETPRLLELMRRACEQPGLAARAGSLARAFVETQATYRHVAGKYLEHLEHCARLHSAVRSHHLPRSLEAHPALGLNLVCSSNPEAESAEAARRLAMALRQAGIDVFQSEVDPVRLSRGALGAIQDLTAPEEKEPQSPRERLQARMTGKPVGPMSAFPERGLALSRARDAGVIEAASAAGAYDLDLYLVEPATIEEMTQVAAARQRARRAVVLVLAPHCAPLDWRMVELLRVADAIWVPSEMHGDIVRLATTLPVSVLALQPAPSFGTQSSTSSRPFRFLVIFDDRSTFARANPFAAIEAFRRAFGPKGSQNLARLVVVARHLHEGEGRARLLQELEGLSSELLEGLSDLEVGQQLAGCQVYVTLHRGEGFADEIGAAIELGKLVIAPSFVGADHPGCRELFLVDAAVREVDEGAYYLDGAPAQLHVADQFWFEPSIEDAAAWMSRLVITAHKKVRPSRAVASSAAPLQVAVSTALSVTIAQVG